MTKKAPKQGLCAHLRMCCTTFLVFVQIRHQLTFTHLMPLSKLPSLLSFIRHRCIYAVMDVRDDESAQSMPEAG